jgi:desulfoferrodoxin (superoxide reductase-like protein)
MKNISMLFIATFLLSIFNLSCGDIDEKEKIVSPRFHTTSDEGLWRDQSGTHVPVITFTANNEIDVHVPLKPTKKPFHYIEVIALMDGNKEVASKKITFNFDEPHAHFKLPDLEKGNYKVVVKCNLHDMWMAPVVLPAKGK